MKILVCVKQVPETDAAIALDEASKTILAGAQAEWKMNRLDEVAVEEAVRIKERQPQTVIDAVTVGPRRAEQAVKRAIGMGADNGVHIRSDSDPEAGPTAAWIAEFAQHRAYDLVLCGTMSEDRMQAMVGPMIAARLGLPCATHVVLAELRKPDRTILVERELEGGDRDRARLRLPAVVCLQSGINRPRYPSLSNLLRANALQLHLVHSGQLSPAAVGQKVMETALPVKTRAGIFLEGTHGEKAVRLLAVLRERALIR